MVPDQDHDDLNMVFYPVAAYVKIAQFSANYRNESKYSLP